MFPVSFANPKEVNDGQDLADLGSDKPRFLKQFAFQRRDRRFIPPTFSPGNFPHTGPQFIVR